MEKLKLIFTYEKPTKNTIRYQEELGDEAHSGRDIAVGTRGAGAAAAEGDY